MRTVFRHACGLTLLAISLLPGTVAAQSSPLTITVPVTAAGDITISGNPITIRAPITSTGGSIILNGPVQIAKMSRSAHTPGLPSTESQSGQAS